MRIVWDEPKRLRNREKHGLDFADLTLEFFTSARIEDARFGRFLAIGPLQDAHVIAVIFESLGSEAVSVVSMRRASVKERTHL